MRPDRVIGIKPAHQTLKKNQNNQHFQVRLTDHGRSLPHDRKKLHNLDTRPPPWGWRAIGSPDHDGRFGKIQMLCRVIPNWCRIILRKRESFSIPANRISVRIFSRMVYNSCSVVLMLISFWRLSLRNEFNTSRRS